MQDLKSASLEEFQEMQGKLSKFIEKRLAVRKQEALERIRSLAGEYDLTFEEIMAAVRTATKRGKAPAIYRTPKNPRQTWSGKGEAPGWFRDHPNPESLRVPGA